MELEQLQKIIAEVLDVDASSVTPEKSFADDLGADSMDRMDIILRLEDALGISIPDEALENIATVGDAMKAIAQAK